MKLIVLKSCKSRIHRNAYPPLAVLKKKSFYSAELQNGASWKIPGTRQNTKKSGSPAQGRSAGTQPDAWVLVVLPCRQTRNPETAYPSSAWPFPGAGGGSRGDGVGFYLSLCLLAGKEISYLGIFDQLFILLTSFTLHNEFKFISFL